MCMFVCLCECRPYVFKVPQGSGKSVKSPAAGVKGSYELSHMGLGTELRKRERDLNC